MHNCVDLVDICTILLTLVDILNFVDMHNFADMVGERLLIQPCLIGRLDYWKG